MTCRSSPTGEQSKGKIRANGQVWKQQVVLEQNPDTALVRRCNLAAGHLITAMGRFPYLFLNLGTYSQAEQWCLRRSGGVQRPLTVLEDILCINAASLVSSFSLTMTECPKVLDQLRALHGREEVEQRRAAEQSAALVEPFAAAAAAGMLGQELAQQAQQPWVSAAGGGGGEEVVCTPLAERLRELQGGVELIKVAGRW